MRSDHGYERRLGLRRKMPWWGDGSATGETKQVGLEDLVRQLGFPRGHWGAMAGSGAGAGQVCALERPLWLPVWEFGGDWGRVPRRREVFGGRTGV